VRARRPWIAASALTLAIAAAACGGNSAGPHTADANNNGGYVLAGPISYQLQISRELNPYSTEDSQYLAGLPTGTAQPGGTQEWYGVFLWAKNQSGHAATTTDNFEVVDTQGTTYHPIKLNPAANPYAWTAQTLEPLGTEPVPDSTASYGPTQGKLVLFKIGTSAYGNRPLTLWILSPAGQKLASISLDL
jgi:hypothetical protein